MTAVESMANKPRPTQACLEVVPRFMKARQSKPVTTIPAPTPAKTAPLNAGRLTCFKWSKHQAETKISTQALPIPVTARNTAQPLRVCTKAIAIAPTQMITSPHRIPRLVGIVITNGNSARACVTPMRFGWMRR